MPFSALPREKEVLGAPGRWTEQEARAQMGLLLGFFWRAGR